MCSQGLENFGPYLKDPIQFLDPFCFCYFFCRLIFLLFIIIIIMPKEFVWLTMSFLHYSESALHHHPFSTHTLISSLLHCGFAVAVCSVGNAVNYRPMSLVLQHLSDEFTLSLRMT